jgi:hypothetical protein
VRTSSALGRNINARVEFKKQVSCPWAETSSDLQAKILSFKNPHRKIVLFLLLPRGQNPLKATILYNESNYNESKHNILDLVGQQTKTIESPTDRNKSA